MAGSDYKELVGYYRLGADPETGAPPAFQYELHAVPTSQVETFEVRVTSRHQDGLEGAYPEPAVVVNAPDARSAAHELRRRLSVHHTGLMLWPREQDQ